jgi:hypothetical protein
VWNFRLTGSYQWIDRSGLRRRGLMRRMAINARLDKHAIRRRRREVRTRLKMATRELTRPRLHTAVPSSWKNLSHLSLTPIFCSYVRDLLLRLPTFFALVPCRHSVHPNLRSVLDARLDFFYHTYVRFALLVTAARVQLKLPRSATRGRGKSQEVPADVVYQHQPLGDGKSDGKQVLQDRLRYDGKW